jgi:hypothetical protein
MSHPVEKNRPAVSLNATEHGARIANPWMSRYSQHGREPLRAKSDLIEFLHDEVYFLHNGAIVNSDF